MLIYLDWRDLSDVLEEDSRFNLLQDKMHAGGHQLLICFAHIIELCRRGPNRPVCRMLLDLEKLPLRWAEEDLVFPLELNEAVNAFCDGREYGTVLPFVKLFAEICPPNELGRRPRANITPAEWYWECWNDPSAKIGEEREKVEARWTAWRSESPGPVPPVPFVQTFERLAACHSVVSRPGGNIPEVAKWVQQSPSRCPGLRTSHEVLQVRLRKRQRRVEGGDMQDSVHVRFAPYVDLITLDGETRDDLRQARALTSALLDRVCKNLDEAMKRL